MTLRKPILARMQLIDGLTARNDMSAFEPRSDCFAIDDTGKTLSSLPHTHLITSYRRSFVQAPFEHRSELSYNEASYTPRSKTASRRRKRAAQETTSAGLQAFRSNQNDANRGGPDSTRCQCLKLCIREASSHLYHAYPCRNIT
jgi:hypothetical protein